MQRKFKSMATLALLGSVALGLAACGSNGAGRAAVAVAEAQDPLIGPGVTKNPTVYSSSLQCLSGHVSEDLVFAIGPIPDKTGKYVIEQDGAILSRAASDMAVSALSRAGVKQVDRLTAGIVEWELKFAGKKVLGDKGGDTVKTKDGVKNVNFRVIRPGQMLGSTHYITGSISELNWNYYSGVAEINIFGVGGGARTFVMTIAMDLKLVNSKTTEIEDTTTYTKKVVGYETKAGIFRFFGNTLVDFNIGEKSQEPVQVALRSILERSIYELISKKAGTRNNVCDHMLAMGDAEVDSITAAPVKTVKIEKKAPVAKAVEVPVIKAKMIPAPAMDINADEDNVDMSKDTGGVDAEKLQAWKAQRSGEGS